MPYTSEFQVFEDIIQEMALVYRHDKRPWLIGFSGGKDSTVLCCLVFEMLNRLGKGAINKKIYVFSSDTMVENPLVGRYMRNMSVMIGKYGTEFGVESCVITAFQKKVGDMVEFEAHAYYEESKKREVKVIGTVKEIKIFEGTYQIVVLEEHIFRLQQRKMTSDESQQ